MGQTGAAWHYTRGAASGKNKEDLIRTLTFVEDAGFDNNKTRQLCENAEVRSRVIPKTRAQRHKHNFCNINNFTVLH